MPQIKLNENTYGGNIYDTQPIGEVIELATDKNPAGYLPCDGRSVKRSDYPDLFKKIGTTFGAEDDEHFNLPTAEDVDTVSTNQLNQALSNFIKESDTVVGDITIGNNCFHQVETDIPDGHIIIGYTCKSWSANNGAFSIITYLKNRAYIVANEGVTISNLTITWFYI